MSLLLLLNFSRHQKPTLSSTIKSFSHPQDYKTGKSDKHAKIKDKLTVDKSDIGFLEKLEKSISRPDNKNYPLIQAIVWTL